MDDHRSTESKEATEVVAVLFSCNYSHDSGRHIQLRAYSGRSGGRQLDWPAMGDSGHSAVGQVCAFQIGQLGVNRPASSTGLRRKSCGFVLEFHLISPLQLDVAILIHNRKLLLTNVLPVPKCCNHALRFDLDS